MANHALRYDVCIIGGGLAGNLQARHLRITLPQISVAMIESRTNEEIAESRKVGESTVEIAGVFMARDLDLWDYLVEHQLPKYGLNYHFPDGSGCTDTLKNYISYLTHVILPAPAWQLDRKVLEKDLLEMNDKDQVKIFRPFKALSISKNAEDYLVEIESRVGQSHDTISARWVIDASGRKQFFDKKFIKNNIIKEPKPNTAAFWVRVKNPNRRCYSETVRDERVMTSPYYSTNHFFGHGYWIWMIPLITNELSIGIVVDKDIFPYKDVFRMDKFLTFLKREQKLCYDLCMSGEIVDNLALRHLPYRSRRFYSSDRWAIIGDAAFFLDPFYSIAISVTAIGICQVTELIKRDLVDNQSSEELAYVANLYDKFFEIMYRLYLSVYKNMYHFIDDPRVMQEKIKFDGVLWFYWSVPTFITKIFLQLPFVKDTIAKASGFEFFREELDELFAALRESEYRPEFIKHIYKLNEVVELRLLNDSVYDSRSFNPFPNLIHCYWYSIKLLIRLLWGVYGIRSFLQIRQWAGIVKGLIEIGVLQILSIKHWSAVRGNAKNLALEQQRLKFGDFKPRKHVVRELEGEEGRSEAVLLPPGGGVRN